VEEVLRVVLLARAAPVLIVLISVIFLGESVSHYKLGGMAIIIDGAILLSM